MTVQEYGTWPPNEDQCSFYSLKEKLQYFLKKFYPFYEENVI